LIVGAPAPGCSEDIQYQQQLKDDAARHGLAERIHWAGHQADVRACIAQMDALLQPCLNEALSLVVLEALREGVPIIAAASGGVPEIVRHEYNGLLVRPNDETALVRAIENFMENRDLRDRLIAGAGAGLDYRFSEDTFRPAIRGLVRGVPA
jgi:glycosyltransferase involved in cell wall biosynthesis